MFLHDGKFSEISFLRTIIVLRMLLLSQGVVFSPVALWSETKYDSRRPASHQIISYVFLVLIIYIKPFFIPNRNYYEFFRSLGFCFNNFAI